MIERYSTPQMAAVWSEQHKLTIWREVEILVVEAWAQLGVASQEAAAAASMAPEVDLVAWKEREAVTHHDVAAFVDLLAASVGEGGEWIHYGLTSSDVLDTASGVLLKQSGELLLEGVAELLSQLGELTQPYGIELVRMELQKPPRPLVPDIETLDRLVISVEKVPELAAQIEGDLFRDFEREVTSTAIGEHVARRLRR